MSEQPSVTAQCLIPPALASTHIAAKVALHATQAQASSDTAATDALIKELKRRRAKLQRKSYRLGKKLYADKPKQVAKQVGKYVGAWWQQAV